MRERPCEASAMEMGEGESVEMGEGELGEKFRRWRWARNFRDGDEASKMREQIEKQRRKREKRIEIMC